MKLSLILEDEDNPRLKAKLPISIFNQPFTSMFTAVTSSFSDPSFSVATNFPSGPSLKFAYNPSSSTPTSFSPISLSLKSGLGLFGSPINSPLIFSANFSFSNSTTSNAIIPTFSLHFKPQFGHFSLHKTTSPSSNPNPDSGSGTHLVSDPNLDYSSSSNSEFVNGFAPDGPLGWQEVKLEPFNDKKEKGEFRNDNGIEFFSDRQLPMWRDGNKAGVLSGFAVKARTIMPLTKTIKVNLRWGVNLPDDWGVKMPYLTVNKIGIERVDKVEEIKEKSNEKTNSGDFELLKGMCFWMTRDLDIMEKENRDLRKCLEDMRLGISAKNFRGASKNGMPASNDRVGEFEQWRSKKNEGNGGADQLKKPVNRATDLENELQKAIKAAAS